MGKNLACSGRLLTSIPFFILFYKYLLSTYSMAGTVLGTLHISFNLAFPVPVRWKPSPKFIDEGLAFRN